MFASHNITQMLDECLCMRNAASYSKESINVFSDGVPKNLVPIVLRKSVLV